MGKGIKTQLSQPLMDISFITQLILITYYGVASAVFVIDGD